MISTNNFSIFLGSTPIYQQIPRMKISIGTHQTDDIEDTSWLDNENLSKCAIRSAKILSPLKSNQENEITIPESERNALNRLAELLGGEQPTSISTTVRRSVDEPSN